MLETNRLTFKLFTMWFLFFFPVCKSNFHMKLNFSSITITFIRNLCHFLKLTIQNQKPYGKKSENNVCWSSLKSKAFFSICWQISKSFVDFLRKLSPLIATYHLAVSAQIRVHIGPPRPSGWRPAPGGCSWCI